MCESSAFVLGKDNNLQKVMENVVTVDPADGKVYLTDLLGDQKIIDGYIKSPLVINLIKKKISKGNIMPIRNLHDSIYKFFYILIT